MLIEQMEHVLEGDEALLSFTRHYEYKAVETSVSTPIPAAPVVDLPKVESDRLGGAALGFGFS